MQWTGPVDELAIREGMVRQSESQAMIMIDMARDRRAVGSVLTPQQVALLPRIEAGTMMRSFPPPRSVQTDSSQPYFEFQVERHATQIPNTGELKYPAPLRDAHVQGEVLAQFIVDTLGHAELSSFKVIKSSHDLFAQSVRDALQQIQFTPAMLNGQKVRQLVQKPFYFTLSP
jgi:TonB family protein